MLTAVVTRGTNIEVQLVPMADEAEGEEAHELDCEFPAEDESGQATGACETGPNPIMPEVKEVAWGAGSFIVLALLMRFVLYPKLRAGMDARYHHIRDEHERADSARAAARAEVAQFESSLATVKAEANERVDEARRTLEAERASRIEELNREIAAKRDAALADAREARAAIEADVVGAVTDVTATTLERATGVAPDPARVERAVAAATQTGARS